MNQITHRQPIEFGAFPAQPHGALQAISQASSDGTYAPPCPCLALARHHIHQLLPIIATAQTRIAESQSALQGLQGLTWEGKAASQARQHAQRIIIHGQRCSRMLSEIQFRLSAWIR
ncbi:hypothetical protein [Bifidobacterium fermentum]|uniref:Uncharacterized protein n=1 Tax=Bifidobacterium fermentum TaxID=3059035 RepID=A0AB39UE55_9BIFI